MTRQENRNRRIALRFKHAFMLIKTIIRNLKNPRFNCKFYYLVLLPVAFLDYKTKSRIQRFANKHWHKAEKFMHRLYWSCDSDF